MAQVEVSLQSVHKALINIHKRAERSAGEILVANFVDAEPLLDLLSTENSQVMYGRRGTGKTHALKFLSQKVIESGHLAIFIDLRSVGSNGSIYGDPNRPLPQRASAIIIDVLGAILNELYEIAVERIGDAPHPDQITARIDDFANAIASVEVSGSIETETQKKSTASMSDRQEVRAELKADSSFGAAMAAESSSSRSAAVSVKRSGYERVKISFGNVGTALTGLMEVLGNPRIWLLIDEWSEVPIDLQPYLADLLRRTVLPVAKITVKIAAIEHRSQFAIKLDRGEYIGFELGSDVSADLNLDDFLVFENNENKAVEFFKKLIFLHYASTDEASEVIDTPEKLMQLLFTQSPVFDEFVRAVEGVPRDALNLISKIGTKAYGQKIAMQHVRQAARDWYQQDKSAVIKGNEGLEDLLTKIIDEVIGNRKARAFLFPSNARDSRIEQLFDSRLLHVLKRNISSHDQPGKRYDVYKIDYGCYVDLINTSKAPQALFEADDVSIEVPKDDYRSIRRAILTL